MTTRNRKRAARIRRTATAALVVIATVAIAFCAVDAAPLRVRIAAVMIAAAATGGSLLLANRRGNLLGWYVIAGLAAGSRIVLQLVAALDR